MEVANELVLEPIVSEEIITEEIEEDELQNEEIEEDELQNEEMQVEIVEDLPVERVFKPYKDFTSRKSKKNPYPQSSNVLKIPKMLGKWIIITGSFYAIVYGLFKFLEFMATFKI
jgi:hypothetical protein